MSAALLHACCMLLPSDYSACCHRWTALLHALFLFVVVACTFVVKVMRCLLPLIVAKVLCCLLRGLFAFSNGYEEFVNESFHCILHLLNSMVEIVLLPFIATFLVVKLTLIGRNLLAIKYQLEKKPYFCFDVTELKFCFWAAYVPFREKDCHNVIHVFFFCLSYAVYAYAGIKHLVSSFRQV